MSVTSTLPEAARKAVEAIQRFASHFPNAPKQAAADAMHPHYPDPTGSADLRYKLAGVAVDAAEPLIRAQERRKTLADVVTRLRGFGVDEDIVQHFESLS